MILNESLRNRYRPSPVFPGQSILHMFLHSLSGRTRTAKLSIAKSVVIPIPTPRKKAVEKATHRLHLQNGYFHLSIVRPESDRSPGLRRHCRYRLRRIFRRTSLPGFQVPQLRPVVLLAVLLPSIRRRRFAQLIQAFLRASCAKPQSTPVLSRASGVNTPTRRQGTSTRPLLKSAAATPPTDLIDGGDNAD